MFLTFNSNDSIENSRACINIALPKQCIHLLCSVCLHDQLKVKVQVEAPYRWQKELELIARELNVGKLELYRYMFGEFLEKVRRKKVALKAYAEANLIEIAT
jgi:hypothetical protein